jgi:hypothetical protein
VRRSFVDWDEQTWLEVDAVSFENGPPEADDDRLVVTIPLAAVRLSKSTAEGVR